MVQKIVSQPATPQVTKAMLRKMINGDDDAEKNYFLGNQKEKVLRQLDAIEKMSFYGPQLANTWKNAREAMIRIARKVGWCDVYFPHSMPDNEQIEEQRKWLLRAVTAEKDKFDRRRHNKSRKRNKQESIRYCKGGYVPPVVYVAGTCDLMKIDEHLGKHWVDIWKVGDWATITNLEKAVLDTVTERPRHKLRRLEVRDLRRYLDKTGGASGACGWTHEELKELPESCLEQLCEVYDLMEIAGVAMEIACNGDVSMIPKPGAKGDISDLRPITVLAILYRMWASARLHGGVFEWQETVIEKFSLRACRPQSSTMDLVLPFAIMAEEAADDGEELKGSSYDLAKAFDSLPFNVNGFGWKVLDHMGCPLEIMMVLMDLYKRIVRRFKVKGNLGKPIPPTGLRAGVQGDALTMILCNLMTLVWFSLQRQGLLIRTDLGGIAKSPPALSGYAKARRSDCSYGEKDY